jgi:hypothetical protein
MYNKKLVASVKCKGKIMREQDDTVFLPFGEEYSILLKNLNTQKAHIKVEIDGEIVIDGLLLSPNESVDLERYVIDNDLSKGPRFKFIEKTEQISGYRGDRIDDGMIRITYQFEVVPEINPPIYRRYDWNYHNDVWYCDNSGSDCDSVSYNSYPSTKPFSMSVDSDAGITTKGSESDQKFVYGSIGELETTIHSIVLQLKGCVNGQEIKKPLTVSRKIKCGVCGKVNNSSNTFCGNCGTNLTYQY